VPDDTKASAEWATENVLKRLEETTPSGQAVSAQIFLTDTVAPEDLPTVAREIVAAAAGAAGEPARSVEIGKIHRSAKSFSVKAAPSVIRHISNLGQVKAVLPAQIEEGMLIRPVRKTPVA
jgi:hypothetical protein